MPVKHTIQKLRVQNLFLMMNPRVSKNAGEVKHRIKALIWKMCISLFYVT